MIRTGKEPKALRRGIVFDRRFEGPPNITQGGYLGGTMAQYLDADTVEVTMRRPTPMGKPLILDTMTPDRVFLFDGETLLNEARPADLTVEIPPAITLEEAMRASLRPVRETPYPNCFGCGSGRSEDDGLHLRSGPVEGRNMVATDWIPHAAAVGAKEGEEVPVPIVWAAMECPLAKARGLKGISRPEELILLGRITTRIHLLPRVGEHCFFMGWPIERVRRRIELAGTLHNAEGRVLVLSRLTFVVLREGVTYGSFS